MQSDRIFTQSFISFVKNVSQGWYGRKYLRARHKECTKECTRCKKNYNERIIQAFWEGIKQLKYFYNRNSLPFQGKHDKKKSLVLEKSFEFQE